MRLVIGLGNPGKRYRSSPHNAGFKVVELLASRHALKGKKHRKLLAEVFQGMIAEERVTLARPLTYMNESGKAVIRLLEWSGCEMQQMLLVVDDLNLPLGRLRLRRQGSDGGHKGLRSVIEWIGAADFARLRIGVDTEGKPRKDVTDYVLSPLSGGELERFEEVCRAAAEAAECWLERGMEFAMRRFNSLAIGIPSKENTDFIL